MLLKGLGFRVGSGAVGVRGFSAWVLIFCGLGLGALEIVLYLHCTRTLEVSKTNRAPLCFCKTQCWTCMLRPELCGTLHLRLLNLTAKVDFNKLPLRLSAR